MNDEESFGHVCFCHKSGVLLFCFSFDVDATHNLYQRSQYSLSQIFHLFGECSGPRALYPSQMSAVLSRGQEFFCCGVVRVMSEEKTNSSRGRSRSLLICTCQPYEIV